MRRPRSRLGALGACVALCVAGPVPARAEPPQPDAAAPATAPDAGPALPADQAGTLPPSEAAPASPSPAAADAASEGPSGQSGPPTEATAQEQSVAPAPEAPSDVPPPPPTFQELAEPPLPETPEVQEAEPTTAGEWNATDLGQHRHDGFLIRLAIGFGYATSGSDRLRYSGVGGPYSVALGYSIIDNLALVVDFFGTGMLSADIAIDGGAARDSIIDARTSGLGLGATYYLMPLNAYVAAALGVGWHGFDAAGGGAQASDPGIALNAMLGKEFWVGEQWGIGLAFQFVLVHSADDYDGPLLGLGYGGLFSATYN